MTQTRPEFERPPLAEQAITVVFDRIPGFSLVDFGILWQKFKSEFPITATHPMRDPVVERFGDQVEPPIMFKLMPDDALPRCIFLSEIGHEQIQIQPDLFSFNWVRIGNAPYPRSEPLLARFCELFERFSEHLAERALPQPKITHCELVNANIIPVGDFGDAHRFFNLPAGAGGFDGLHLESQQLQAQYILHDANGRPFGRLRQSLTPVLRIEDGQKAYRFELTARGNPDSGNLSDSVSFFGMGRDVINATFVASTTETAHAHWGKK